MEALFTDIAAVYDRMNHVLSLGRDVGWRDRAAALVKGAPARILDVAAGTGDFSFALARRFPEATVEGVDLTPAMLARARAKNAFPRVSFRVDDAQRLATVADASCDLCSCAFGFRNFPDKRAALAAAARVLAPGGELLVLEFFRPQSRVLGACTALWVRTLAGLFVRRHAAAYAHLRESMKATVSEAEFVAFASEAGFTLRARRFFFPCCTCLIFVKVES